MRKYENMYKNNGNFHNQFNLLEWHDCQVAILQQAHVYDYLHTVCIYMECYIMHIASQVQLCIIFACGFVPEAGKHNLGSFLQLAKVSPTSSNASNLLSTMSNELFSLNMKLMSADDKQKKEIEFVVHRLETISRSIAISLLR